MNPFEKLISVQIDGKTRYINEGSNAENIKEVERILKEAKENNPSAKIYGKVHFGHYEYRIA